MRLKEINSRFRLENWNRLLVIHCSKPVSLFALSLEHSAPKNRTITCSNIIDSVNLKSTYISLNISHSLILIQISINFAVEWPRLSELLSCVENFEQKRRDICRPTYLASESETKCLLDIWESSAEESLVWNFRSDQFLGKLSRIQIRYGLLGLGVIVFTDDIIPQNLK